MVFNKRKLQISSDHRFDTDAALERIQALTAYWQAKYGVDLKWRKNRCTIGGRVLGIGFEASIEVKAAHVMFEGPDPSFVIRRFVKRYLDHKLGQYMDPNTPVAELEERARQVA